MKKFQGSRTDKLSARMLAWLRRLMKAIIDTGELFGGALKGLTIYAALILAVLVAAPLALCGLVICLAGYGLECVLSRTPESP